MKFLIKRLLDTFKITYSEINFINDHHHLFKMIDEGVPISTIADEMTRDAGIGFTPDDVRLYIKALESLGYRDKTAFDAILNALRDYIILLYLTFLSLFNEDIVSMGKYQKVLDEVNSLSDLKVTGNKTHLNLVKISINYLVASRQDYEIAVNYLNFLKTIKKDEI